MPAPSRATYILTLAFCLVGIHVCAQFDIQTSNDNEPKPDTWAEAVTRDGSFAYVVGGSSSTCGAVPFAAKIDITTGQVVWNTIDQGISFDPAEQSARACIIATDALYFITRNVPVSGPNAYLYKLNKTTGALIWRVALNLSHSDLTLFNVDDDYLRLASQIYRKDNGSLETNATATVLCTAQDGSLWISVGSAAVKKVVDLDFDNPINIVTIPTHPSQGAIQSVDYAIVYGADRILIVSKATSSAGQISMINTTNNSIVWTSIGGLGHSISLVKWKIVDDKLFLAWRATSTGTSGFRIQKIDLSDGTTLWSRSHTFTAPSYTTQRPGSAVAYDFDVNSDGDVFVSGTAHVEVYHFGDAGMMKLSGTNGDKLFEKMISDDEDDFDERSVCLRMSVVADQPYVIANLAGTLHYDDGAGVQAFSGGVTVATLAVDPDNGDLTVLSRLTGKEELNTAVTDIISYGTGHVLKLEQKGRYSVLSRWDHHGQLQWQKKLKAGSAYMSKPLKLTALGNGDIAVLTQSYWVYDQGFNDLGLEPTYYAALFTVSPAGEFIREVSLYGSGSACDMYADASYGYVTLDNFSNGTNLYKFNSSGVVDDVHISATLETSPYHRRNIVESSAGNLYLMGKYMFGAMVNKTTLQTQVLPMPGFTYQTDVADVLIVGDTIHMAFGNHSDCCLTFTNRAAWSISSNSYIWSTTTSGNNRKLYYKLIEGEPGYLYALGRGDFQGMTLSKINRKTGVIVWEVLRVYATSMNGFNIHFDPVRKEVVVVGDRTDQFGVKSWATLVLNKDGTQVLYDEQSAYPGTAVAIAMNSDGDIVVGGSYKASECDFQSLGFHYVTSPLPPANVQAGDGASTAHVAISWSQTGTVGQYFAVYRNTTSNAATATLLSGWTTNTTFEDATAAPGQVYYYFVKAALDALGGHPSEFGAVNSGFRGVTAPVVQASDGTSNSAVTISWTAPPGATLFRVYRSATNNFGSSTMIVDWTSSLATTDTPGPGTELFYFVKGSVTGTDGEPAGMSAVSVGNGGYMALQQAGLSADDSGSGSITISWPAVPGASNYRLYRSVASGGASAVPVTLWTGELSFDDHSITPGVLYSYFLKVSIQPIDTIAVGKHSTSTAVDAMASIAKPIITASDGSSGSNIQVQWSAVSGAQFYKLYRYLNDPGVAVPITDWIVSQSYNDTDIVPARHYSYYVIAAVTNSGLVGEPAGMSAVSEGDEGYMALQQAGLSAGDSGNGVVTISWPAVPGASNYRLYRSVASGGASAVPVTLWTGELSFTDNSVTPGILYSYFLKSSIDPIDTISVGKHSTSTTVNEMASIAMSIVTASDGSSGSDIQVQWSAVSGAHFYKLYRYLNDPGDAVQITDWIVSQSYNDTGIVPARLYTYYVIAAVTSSGSQPAGQHSISEVNDGFASLSKAQVTIEPLSVAAINMSWQTVPGATFYQVYRANAPGFEGAVQIAEVQGTGFSDDTALRGRVYFYYVLSGSGAEPVGPIAGFTSVSEGVEGIRLVRAAELQAGAQLTTHVALSWNDDNTAMYYRVYRALSGNSSFVPVSAWLQQRELIDSGIDIGRLYSYKVRTAAFPLEDLKLSQYSWSDLAEAGRILGTPVLTATDGDHDDAIEASWNRIEGAQSYVVYRSVNADGTSSVPIGGSVDGNSFRDPDVGAGTSFYYHVKAVAPDEQFNAVSAVEEGYRRLLPPTIISASQDKESQIDVAWTSDNGSVYFKLYRAEVDDNNLAIAVTGWTTALSFSDLSAGPGKSYYYFAKAAAGPLGERPSFFSESMEGEVQLVLEVFDSGFNVPVVFPNPTEGLFTIESHGTISQLRLVDMLGREAILSESRAVHDISDRPAGVYLLKVESEGRIHSIRVIRK